MPSPEIAGNVAAVDGVVEAYRSRQAAYRRDADAAARTDRWVGIARLVCFAVLALGVIAIAESQLDALSGTVLLAVVGAAFFLLIGWHSTVRERVRTLRALDRSCDAGAARVLREWDAMPAAIELAYPPSHAFAGDLHLADAHGAVRLFPAVSRFAGGVVLGEWLLAQVPPSADVLCARQDAARELAPHAEWRERLSVLASRLAAPPRSVEAFLAWAERPAARIVWLRWMAMVLAVLTVASFVGALLGRLPAAVPMVFVVANLIITAWMHRVVDGALDAVAGHETRLRGVGDVLRHVVSRPAVSAELIALTTRLGGSEAVSAFGWFDQFAKFAEVRLSPMGHYALQALVLWDFHVVDALERWRMRHGASARAWLRVLGDVEALAAFGTLAYDNPSWTFPAIADDPRVTLDATNLAHPLLGPIERVGNDVGIGGAGDVLFITGSNMSGKSTLLRAIGLNVVLAQAGAPVCASAMRLSRVRLRTSVDATDALERGLSLFMAELLRIKAIVDDARAEADCPLLFIADEMLRGTNARDRHAAVITILGRLVREGAVGVVATHDPDLAGDERLRAHVRPYHLLEHFRVEGAATSMWFDYRLRPGLATTRNAIQLLELVGLGDAAIGRVGGAAK